MTNVVPMGRTAAALRACDGVDDQALIGLAEVGGVKWLLSSVDTSRAIACVAVCTDVPIELIEQLISSGGLKALIEFQMKSLAANTVQELFQRITVATETRRQTTTTIFNLISKLMEELKRT